MTERRLHDGRAPAPLTGWTKVRHKLAHFFGTYEAIVFIRLGAEEVLVMDRCLTCGKESLIQRAPRGGR